MLRNRTLLAVSLAVCAAFTGIGMVVPVRVLYAESRGASLAIIGAMASSYLISNFLFQYPSCWLVAIVIVAIMIRVKVQASQEAQEEVKPLSLRTLFRLPLLGAYILGFGDYLFLGFDITLTALWLHDHLGASVAVIGLAYVAFAIPTIITSPFAARVADPRRRSTMILIFVLSQGPIYMIYGFANSVLIIIIFFAIHGVVYSFMQPAVDAHVASSTIPGARARIQGLYSAAGLIGGFAGANGCSFLYGLNFRLPLFAIGVAFGICVIVGGTLVRISETRNPTLPRPDKSKTRQIGERGVFTTVSE